jgi:DNA polymerase-3 subunit alpha
VEPWLPAERLRREYESVGFFLSGHPLDDYATVLKKLRVQPWAEFARAVKAGATAGRIAATVVSRLERRTRTGSKMGIIGLSDPTGHFEAVIFSEGLAEYRDLLEPGNAVLLFLSAEMQGDEVRARIQSAEPLDDAAATLQKGLRVFLRDDGPLEGVAKRLEPAPRATHANGDGEVSVVLLLRRGAEVEVKLPGRFKVSPQIASAIKAVPGVVQVEAL